MEHVGRVIRLAMLFSGFLLLGATGSHAADLSGTVTSDGSTGIAQAQVTVHDLSGLPVSTVYTDAGGFYFFSGLAEGPYKIKFGRAGFYAQWYSGKPDLNSADTVNAVNSQATSNINAQMVRATGGISGRVTSDGARGIGGILVSLKDPATGAVLQTAATDANGDYLLTSIATGTYSVYFDGASRRRASRYFNNKADLSAADPVYAADGSTTANISAVLASTAPASKIGVYQNGYWYLDANQSWDWNGVPPDIFGIFGIGLPNAIPVVGDWNGDGITEIGIYSDGIWYLDMNNNWQWDGEGVDVRGVFGIGLPNAIPVTGDWNGDGKTEIGIYSNGYWYLDTNGSWDWNGTPTDTFGVFGIGLPNAIPVTGDWNGDGITEIGIYSDGNWYLDKNQSWQWDGTPTDTYGLFGVGLPNVQPVTGDWNGDGITKIGVYSEGNWYLDTNASWQWDGTPTDTYGLFGVGLGTVVPVTGNFISGGGAPPVVVSGSVVNTTNNAVIPSATVKVKTGDGTNRTLYTTTAGLAGTYSISVPAGQPVYFHVEHAGYATMNTGITSFTAAASNYTVYAVDVATAVSIITSEGLCAGETSMSDPCIAGGKWLGINTSVSSGVDAAGVAVSVAPAGVTQLYNDGTGVFIAGGATAVRTTHPEMPMVSGFGSAAGLFIVSGTNGLVTQASYFALVPGEITFVPLFGF